MRDAEDPSSPGKPRHYTTRHVGADNGITKMRVLVVPPSLLATNSNTFVRQLSR